MKKLLFAAVLLACAVSGRLAMAQPVTSYVATDATTGARIATPVTSTTPLPITCPDGTCGGSAGSLSATASSLPTPVVAGANKPLNIGLFSNLFITPVSPTGTQIDLSNQCVWGVDAATCASLSNLFPTSAQLTAGTALAGKFGIDQTTPGTTNRVSIDQTTPGTTNAVQPVAGTTGGATSYGLQAAATTNSTNVKNAASTLYGMHVYNTTTTIYYLRMYDSASAPTCSSATGFTRTFPIIPAAAAGGGGGSEVHLPAMGVAFTTGMSFCVTGGPTSTDNTAAAVGVFINLDYK